MTFGCLFIFTSLSFYFIFSLLSMIRYKYFFCIYLQTGKYMYYSKYRKSRITRFQRSFYASFFSYSIETLRQYPLKIKDFSPLFPYSHDHNNTDAIKTHAVSTTTVKSGIDWPYILISHSVLNMINQNVRISKNTFIWKQCFARFFLKNWTYLFHND